MYFGWCFTPKLSIVKFLEVKLILYCIDYYNKAIWNEQDTFCKKLTRTQYGKKKGPRHLTETLLKHCRDAIKT